MISGQCCYAIRGGNGYLVKEMTIIKPGFQGFVRSNYVHIIMEEYTRILIIARNNMH